MKSPVCRFIVIPREVAESIIVKSVGIDSATPPSSAQNDTEEFDWRT